jgi:hypothetical protein
MAVRQFTGLRETGHIGDQRGARDRAFVEGFYHGAVDFRTHPEIVSIHYDLPGSIRIQNFPPSKVAVRPTSIFVFSFYARPEKRQRSPALVLSGGLARRNRGASLHIAGRVFPSSISPQQT